MQVMVGSAIGILEAFLWWLSARRLQKRHNKCLGQRVCWGIVHNYALPRFVVRTHCVRLLALSDDGSVLRSERRSELEDMAVEIDWYLQMTEDRIADQDDFEMNFLEHELHDLKPLRKMIRRRLYGRG